MVHFCSCRSTHFSHVRREWRKNIFLRSVHECRCLVITHATVTMCATVHASMICGDDKMSRRQQKWCPAIVRSEAVSESIGSNWLDRLFTLTKRRNNLLGVRCPKLFLVCFTIQNTHSSSAERYFLNTTMYARVPFLLFFVLFLFDRIFFFRLVCCLEDIQNSECNSRLSNIPQCAGAVCFFWSFATGIDIG